MSNFLIFKAAFNNSATPAIGTYTAEGATAQFNKDTSISPDYYLYNTVLYSAVQWFIPTAETTDFEFAADILTRYWDNQITYFIIADSTGTTGLRMWSVNDNWHFENSDSTGTTGNPEYIGVINPTTSGGFGVFHQFRVRVRKLTASSSSVEVYVDGTLKLTATAGAALVTCAKIGFVGGVNSFGPGTGGGVKNAYVYDLSDGDVVNPGVLSGAFNRFISWMKSKFALKSDIPTVNNGTLTIQKNGTNVATFTANQSTAATANITVPTKTSDLTNDSGFITSDNTKIPLAGSNQISGDLIPSTDGTVNLGSSSYQWNQAYIKSLTINGVACGDILTHNASEFVDVSSAQTIGGLKTFSSGGCIFFKQIKINHNLEYGKNNPPSQSAYHNLMFTDANDWWGGYIENVTDTNGNSSLAFYVRNTNEIQSRVYLKCDIDGSFSMYPLSNNVWDLGTSTNKWKSFNGINPGALSLPGTFVNVDTTNWLLDGSNVNIFTPASDGWLGIQCTDTVYDQTHYVFVGRNDNASYHSQNVLSPISARWSGSYHGCVFIPVIKNVRYDIRCICSSIIATFYPCQGNV